MRSLFEEDDHEIDGARFGGVMISGIPILKK